MPRKPTGQTGPIGVQFGPAGAAVQWARIKFSENKDEVEKAILALFISETRKCGATILDAIKNVEDNFDFTLTLPGGKVFLDLAEIIYRDGKGKPYDSRKIKIEGYKFAEQIRDSVLKKSDHYGRAGKTPIHLLTYLTHWRFEPTETVIRLVQHFLQKTPPIMENVFFLSPLDESSARVRVLYPSVNPLEGKDPAEFKNNSYLNLDPANYQLGES